MKSNHTTKLSVDDNIHFKITNKKETKLHTHTHTHTYIYIYIHGILFFILFI